VCGLCRDWGRDDDLDDARDAGLDDCGLDPGLPEVGRDRELPMCAVAWTFARSVFTSCLYARTSSVISVNNISFSRTSRASSAAPLSCFWKKKGKKGKKKGEL